MKVTAYKSVQEVASMVAADCRADAASLDGRPFNGRTVAESLGQILAMVMALADCIERLAAAGVSPKEPTP